MGDNTSNDEIFSQVVTSVATAVLRDILHL